VAEHAFHAVIDQLLGDGRAGARIGLIVLRIQHDLDFAATDDRLGRVEVFHCQRDAILEIGAVVSLRAGQRTGETHFHIVNRVGGMRRRQRNRTHQHGACQPFCRLFHVLFL